MYRNINREKRNILYVERREIVYVERRNLEEEYIKNEDEGVCGTSKKKVPHTK